jgi:hypothetical protein
MSFAPASHCPNELGDFPGPEGLDSIFRRRGEGTLIGQLTRKRIMLLSSRPFGLFGATKALQTGVATLCESLGRIEEGEWKTANLICYVPIP